MYTATTEERCSKCHRTIFKGQAVAEGHGGTVFHAGCFSDATDEEIGG